MAQIQEIKINLDGIGNTLKTHRFRVPPYQRSYAWEKEHVQALLSDINDAIKNKENEYFLGSVVVTGPIDQRCEVVDGQQRLTTVSLLIAAIKDIFAETDDTEVVNSVKTEFLASTDRKTKEKEPRLVLNEIDNQQFQYLIEGIPQADPETFTRQSHKRLLTAATTIYDYLKELCSKSKDQETELHSWLDYLEKNLKVIVVTAPDDSNAFVIFETLNDRGLELAISDLLKNYLFHKSGDALDDTRNRWLSMVAVLESASDDPLIATYLRQVAMSKYGVVRERDLFGMIRKKITNKKLALTFSTELCDGSKTYSALINVDHEFWSKYDPKVRESVRILNLLGMTQIRPLLLAILNRFDPKNVKTIFEKLVAVAVRFQIVGGAGGGTLERIYSETAKKVTDRELTTPDHVVKAFTTLPADSAFEQAFALASISKQSLARYYLSALEGGVIKNATQELVANKDLNHVNLEHILPLTLSANWSLLWSADDSRAFQRRLGNHALMATKDNSRAGNTDFSEKKAVLQKI